MSWWKWFVALFGLFLGLLGISLGVTRLVNPDASYSITAMPLLFCGFAAFGIGVTALTVIGVEEALKEFQRLKKELE